VDPQFNVPHFQIFHHLMISFERVQISTLQLFSFNSHVSVADPLLPKEAINQDFTMFVFYCHFILYLL